MSVNANIVDLANLPEYQGLNDQQKADLANTKRIPWQDPGKKNFEWFVRSPDFGQAASDAFAKLLLDTNRHATYGAMIGEGLPFNTDAMQAGLDKIAEENPSNSAILAMVAKIKALGRRLISDIESRLGPGFVATPEMFAEARAENNRTALIGLVDQAAARTKGKILSGDLTTEAAVKTELGN